MIQAPDGANLDWYLKVRLQKADAALDGAVVLIDDASYESDALFDGRSPLKPRR